MLGDAGQTRLNPFGSFEQIHEQRLCAAHGGQCIESLDQIGETGEEAIAALL